MYRPSFPCLCLDACHSVVSAPVPSLVPLVGRTYLCVHLECLYLGSSKLSRSHKNNSWAFTA